MLCGLAGSREAALAGLSEGPGAPFWYGRGVRCLDSSCHESRNPWFCLISVPGNDLTSTVAGSPDARHYPPWKGTSLAALLQPLSDILGMLSIFPAEKMNAYPLSPVLTRIPHLQGTP
jgi:hypothetical protein